MKDSKGIEVTGNGELEEDVNMFCDYFGISLSKSTVSEKPSKSQDINKKFVEE